MMGGRSRGITKPDSSLIEESENGQMSENDYPTLTDMISISP